MGVVVAEGNIGSHLDKSNYERGLFVSADGANTWTKVLDGRYSFEVSDYGSIIIAGSKDSYTDDLFYSID